MATIQYDLAQGDDLTEVDETVSGGGSLPVAVRLTLDLAKVDHRLEALDLIDRIKLRILQDPWPPAS